MTEPDRPERDTTTPRRPQDDRLAQALRENLKRRKAHRSPAPAAPPATAEDPRRP